MTQKKNELFFLPLGGSGEIGMNLNLYCYNDEWLMVDLGITFDDKLGIEIITPNPQYIVERAAKLKGILLTHAHEDHIGAIPYLLAQLKFPPLYATPFTASLIRNKLVDAGIADKTKLIEIPLSGKAKIGPFELELVTLTHSIPEPNGVLIKCPAGNIFHTGDWKLDPEPLIGDKSDEIALKRIGDEGVLAMVCDSTNVFQEGTSGSENDVRTNLIEAVKNHPQGRVIVTCFSSNVARLSSIAHAAKSVGRRVVMAGRSIARMDEAARANGYLTEFDSFLSPRDDVVKSMHPDKVLYICTGSQGEGRAALWRIADGTHPDIRIEAGDTIIFSSRVIPGNEKRIGELKNKLIRQGVRVVTQHHYDIHVSGHPARDELKMMYEWIRPRIAIPVHGELRHMVEHGRLAKKCGIPEIIIPENGTLVRLSPDPAEIVDEVCAGRLALDGTTLVKTDHGALKDRSRLSAQGAVFITIALDPENELIDEPFVTIVGLVNVDNIFATLKKSIADKVGLWSMNKSKISELKDTVMETVRRTCSASLGKKPMIFVHIVEGD